MANPTITEEWRPIEGHPHYEVSNIGRVRSLDRALIRPGPRGGPLRLPGKMLKPYPNTKGYLLVDLSTACRAQKVHALVCRTFNGHAPDGKTQVAHWDGDKTNNLFSNLRWVTNQENQEDSKRHGTRPRGSKKHNAKLNENDVEEIRRLLELGWSHRKIASHFGVSKGPITCISHGKTWNHVSTAVPG